MCKPTSEIEQVVLDLIDVKKMISELEEEAAQLQKKVTEYMGEEETMICGNLKVTYTNVASKRIDTKALKELLGDALDPYFNVIISRRFQIR